jgi:putative ribosome biogenesis GTPase RsgA
MASTLNDKYDCLFKVLCIGDSGVGKSSLVARCKGTLQNKFIFGLLQKLRVSSVASA